VVIRCHSVNISCHDAAPLSTSFHGMLRCRAAPAVPRCPSHSCTSLANVLPHPGAPLIHYKYRAWHPATSPVKGRGYDLLCHQRCSKSSLLDISGSSTKFDRILELYMSLKRRTKPEREPDPTRKFALPFKPSSNSRASRVEQSVEARLISSSTEQCQDGWFIVEAQLSFTAPKYFTRNSTVQ
jgi:hypothetical protein